MLLADIEDYHYACGCKGADGNYSNAFGDGHVFKNFRRNQAKRQNLKQQQAKQNAKVINTLSKAAATDTSVQDAIKATKSMDAKSNKKGLSTGAKIGIGVGIALVVGVGGYLIYRHYHKKGK